MKCLCGFNSEEFGSSYDENVEDGWIVSRLEVSETIRVEYSSPDVIYHTVFACPKCGTLKINI